MTEAFWKWTIKVICLTVLGIAVCTCTATVYSTDQGMRITVK